jgi:hypothetical protein
MAGTLRCYGRFIHADAADALELSKIDSYRSESGPISILSREKLSLNNPSEFGFNSSIQQKMVARAELYEKAWSARTSQSQKNLASPAVAGPRPARGSRHASPSAVTRPTFFAVA